MKTKVKVGVSTAVAVVVVIVVSTLAILILERISKTDRVTNSRAIGTQQQYNMLPEEYPWLEDPQPLSVTIESIHVSGSEKLEYAIRVSSENAVAFSLDSVFILNTTSRLLGEVLSKHLTSQSASILRNAGGRQGDQVVVSRFAPHVQKAELLDYIVTSEPEAIEEVVRKLETDNWTSVHSVEVFDPTRQKRYRTLVRWYLDRK